MKCTIKSKYGLVTFSRPQRYYVYIDFDGRHPGTLGRQICRGGNLLGSTITFESDNATAFSRMCKKWWKQYLRNTNQ